jgi:hypothetical protein
MEEFDSSNPEHAKAAIKEYKKHVGPAPAPNTDKKSNTRAVWFSLEQLTSFINRLERERVYSYAVASDQDRKTGEGIIDGVRVYFATYPDGYEYENDAHKDYKGRNTVFFISTKGGKEHGVHEDEFDRQTQLDGYSLSNKSRHLKSRTTDPENTGELSPPKIKGIDGELIPIDEWQP